MTTFSKSDSIEQAWELTKANFWFLVGLAFIVALVSNLPASVAELVDHEGLTITLSVISWVVQIFLSIGIIDICLKLARGENANWGQLWTKRHLFWRYIGGSILYSLIVVGGLLLLIIPGVIWGLKYQFFTYALVDKELSVMEALQESSRLTQGHKGNIFVLNILLSLIAMLGLLLLFIGLLVAMPIIWLAYSVVYLKLQELSNPAQPKTKVKQKSAASAA
jgi:hypothetical protein